MKDTHSDIDRFVDGLPQTAMYSYGVSPILLFVMRLSIPFFKGWDIPQNQLATTAVVGLNALSTATVDLSASAIFL